MSDRQPNIVLFFMDQCSAKWVEAAEAGACELPNIGRLRSRGVSFTNCMTSNPVCCPTRATIATGLTTRGHGVLENGYRLDPALPTFMRSLQAGGWRTGALGKVHLRPHFETMYPDYKPYGFDVTQITEDPRGGVWLDWVEQEHPEHYEAALATIWAAGISEWAAYGPRKIDLRDRIRKAREKYQLKLAYALPFPQEVSQTNWITACAAEFIREAPADRPLLAHIGYVQPHGPFCPPGEYLDRVNVEAIPQPLAAEWVDEPDAISDFRGHPDPSQWPERRHHYFADLIHLDEQLGRILDTLDDTGRADNTYVILMADHGEMLGDHGFGSKLHRHYDACIRVPLIVSGPGLQQGASRDEIVQLEDICPTVLDMAGQRLEPMPHLGPYLQAAAEDIPIMPGRSVLGLCRGESVPDWRTAAYSESYNGLGSFSTVQWARTVRTARHRYTMYPEDAGEQLFDLQDDPGEQNNLACDPPHAEVRRELRDQLLELIILQDYPKTRRDLFSLGVH